MVSEFLDDDSINPKPIEIVMTVKVRGESALLRHLPPLRLPATGVCWVDELDQRGPEPRTLTIEGSLNGRT